MDKNGNHPDWAVSEAGKQLKEKLNDEHTVQIIDRLLNRIETLELAVERLTTVMEQGPGMVSMVADMADEGYKNAAAKGIQLEERLSNALTIAEKLTANDMVDKMDKLINFSSQLPGLISMKVDIIDEAIRNSAAKGIDLEHRVTTAANLAEKLTDPEVAQNLEQLVALSKQAPGMVAMFTDIVDEEVSKATESGFDIGLLTHHGKKMTRALALAEKMEDPGVGGIFGMMRAIKDADRQKALGFMMNFAKAYGKLMK